MNRVNLNSISLNSINTNNVGKDIDVGGKNNEIKVTLKLVNSKIANLFGSGLTPFNLNYIYKMWLDGVEVTPPITSYTFPSLGEHIMRVQFKEYFPSFKYMFYGCRDIIYINTSKFDTSKVTDMSNFCAGVLNLENIYLSSFDTSKVTNMSNMFVNCNKLKALDLSSFDTSKVTDMSYFVTNCYELEALDLSSFDTSKVTDMSNAFRNCYLIKAMPMLNASSLTNVSRLFEGCIALEHFGGLKGLKVALDLSYSPKLTHQSLMNVINNLYDLTANGLSGKTLTLGSTNLAKLTADEIAIATNKGWTVK